MAFIDLSRETLEIFHAGNASEAFADWYANQGDEVRAAFSVIIGLAPLESASGLCTRWPQRALPLIGSMLDDSNWLAYVEETRERAKKLFEGVYEAVNSVALIGFGQRNASQGYWKDRGLAFLWLEHFLPPGSDSGFLDLGLEQIPAWLGHEIAHAARYAVPSSASPVPRLMKEAEPEDFFRLLDSCPLAERLVDEGMATAVSRIIAPDISNVEILHLPSEALRYLEDHETELRHTRMEKYDFFAARPSKEALDDLFHFFPDRLNGPWTLERPPTRWGYWWGDRLVRRGITGNWPEDIGASVARFDF